MRSASPQAQALRHSSTLQIGLGWFPERPTGVNRFYFDLWRHLPERDMEFHGCVLGSDRVANETGGRVRAFAPETLGLASRLLAARRTVSQLMDERRPALVASHFALFALPVLDRLGNMPLAVHFHGPWARESAVEGGSRPSVALKRAIERLVYRRADRIIVLSRAFARELTESYGVREDRVRIVPGGVTVDAFSRQPPRREARVQLGWPVDRPIILSVRRLVKRVGLEDLVDAMRTVEARIPDALLMIAGAGPLQETLARRVGGERQGVKLLGRVPDHLLPLAYRAADLTVVPSVALEGFGLVTLESLAAGTPVLVTPVGGLPEVVQELSPDLVLPGTGPDALAEGICAALGGAVRLPGSAQCEEYVRRRFDWPVIADRIRSVYAEVA